MACPRSAASTACSDATARSKRHVPLGSPPFRSRTRRLSPAHSSSDHLYKGLGEGIFGLRPQALVAELPLLGHSIRRGSQSPPESRRPMCIYIYVYYIYHYKLYITTYIYMCVCESTVSGQPHTGRLLPPRQQVNSNDSHVPLTKLLPLRKSGRGGATSTARMRSQPSGRRERINMLFGSCFDVEEAFRTLANSLK